MSGNGKKRAPLVAERPYPANAGGKSKPAAKKPTPKKTARKPAKRRTAAPKRARPTSPIGWLLLPFRWTLRLLWAFSWRVGVVTALIIGGFSLYFAAQMPAMADLHVQMDRDRKTTWDAQAKIAEGTHPVALKAAVQRIGLELEPLPAMEGPIQATNPWPDPDHFSHAPHPAQTNPADAPQP